MVLLVQPFSAAAERVFFSLLSNSFTEQQMSSLEDYIETSIMINITNRTDFILIFCLIFWLFLWNNFRIITICFGII